MSNISQKSYFHTKSCSKNTVFRQKQSECDWSNQHLQSYRIQNIKMWNTNKQVKVQSKYYSYLESASSPALMGQPTAAIRTDINVAWHNALYCNGNTDINVKFHALVKLAWDNSIWWSITEYLHYKQNRNLVTPHHRNKYSTQATFHSHYDSHSHSDASSHHHFHYNHYAARHHDINTDFIPQCF
jgi:hypothetical protein